MNKSIYIIFALVLSFIFPQVILAASTTVTVTVYDANGNPVNDATVSITCEGETLAGVSNNDNVYQRTFGNNKCDPGQTVLITVVGPDGATGSTQGVMGNSDLDISLNLSEVTSVPEFGLVPGIIAAGGSMLGYLKLRKRK